jgi:lysophospholipid acyltransferase (LPLAT)-like uncharacterized protein
LRIGREADVTIRHPVVIKVCGLAGALVLRSWMGSMRFRLYSLGDDVSPFNRDVHGPCIYAIRHENLLFPVYHFRRAKMRYLISRHADGELLAEVGRHLRVPMVRGSTTQGGIEAIRRIIHDSRKMHLGLAPDGPHGPRRRVQPGVVYVAARTGMPIVPTGFGYCKPWRLESWDRMAVPRPWSLATAVTAGLVRVPDDVSKAELENYRSLVEKRMLRAT